MNKIKDSMPPSLLISFQLISRFGAEINLQEMNQQLKLAALELLLANCSIWWLVVGD